MIRRALTFLLLALILGGGAAAGAGGVGELLLDRNAVAAVIAAELPAKTVVALGALGQVTVKFQAPDAVTFESDGVAASVGLLLVEPGLKGAVQLRLRPEVDQKANVVRLRVVRAQGEGALAALPDLANLLRPIELPRHFDSVLLGPQGARTEVTTRVDGVEIQRERLVIKLGFDAKPLAPARQPAK